MKKLVIPEVLARSVMTLCEGVKSRVRVDCELSEELEVKGGIHKGSVFLPFIVSFARCCSVIGKSWCVK